MTFGTFYNCFCGRKTPNSRDYASNCPYPVANFSRQSNSLIYWKKLLPENYRAVFYDIWTIDRGDIGAYSIRYKLRSLEARQNWYFKCLLFKNYWTDLLEIFTESAKVYSYCVCEISKRSKPNYSFEDQKIGKTYKNSTSFNTWVTVVKHSWIIASMSSNIRLF